MATVERVAERLHWNDGQHVAAAIWCEDDVLERAEELGLECSREQARYIIDRIDDKQDCSLGITWDTIDCYLCDFKESRLKIE
jgi:hypothetical protein